MCKELQSICTDYDGGIAHSKHIIVLYSSKDFPRFLRELRNPSALKFFRVYNMYNKIH